LAAILDLFSRKIVGWAMDETLESILVEQAYHMPCKTADLPQVCCIIRIAAVSMPLGLPGAVVCLPDAGQHECHWELL